MMKKGVLVNSWMLLGAGLGISLCVIFFVSLRWINLERNHPIFVQGDEPQSLVLEEIEPLSSKSIPKSNLVPFGSPHIEYVPGSIEDACGLKNFPQVGGLYTELDESDRNELLSTIQTPDGDWVALESAECRSALDLHMNATIPYLWGSTYEYRPFAFVKLEEPLTFERIFADPTGDFLRVREAMLRDECLLRGEEVNWALKETCHASAFLNYALINRFCFEERIDNQIRARYWADDDPTAREDRSMWKQELEDAWVRETCEGMAPELEFFSVHNLQLFNSLLSTSKQGIKDPLVLLIEHAARLGDEAAGLTQPHPAEFSLYDEEGYKYGRFATLLTSDEWIDFAWRSVPSTDRFLKAFHMLDTVLTHNTNGQDVVQFDWEFVVRHLCEQPYYVYGLGERRAIVTQYPSCREVVHEIRQRLSLPPTILDVLDEFERVAVGIGMYN